MTSLVLGSRSPARRATLQAAGIAAEVRQSDVDEDAMVAEYQVEAPEDVSLLLARKKAESVASGILSEREKPTADVVVLGCDSVFFQNGAVHGKPHTIANARARLRELSGNSGELYSGLWLIDLRSPEDGGTGATIGTTTRTTVHIDPLSETEIEAYLASGEPLEVAGSFTIDGLGGPFVRGVEGDHHNVVGISLPALRSLLKQVNLSVIDFWPTHTNAEKPSSVYGKEELL